MLETCDEVVITAEKTSDDIQIVREVNKGKEQPAKQPKFKQAALTTFGFSKQPMTVLEKVEAHKPAQEALFAELDVKNEEAARKRKAEDSAKRKPGRPKKVHSILPRDTSDLETPIPERSSQGGTSAG
jgi:predicted transposase YbfD/YdcC